MSQALNPVGDLLSVTCSQVGSVLNSDSIQIWVKYSKSDYITLECNLEFKNPSCPRSKPHLDVALTSFDDSFNIKTDSTRL